MSLAGRGDAMSCNLVTGKPYRGINVLMLDVAAMSSNHADDRWLTFMQANEIGARIRKGEHGMQIAFYRVREIKEATDYVAETDLAVRQGIPMLKIYTVFNASQLEVVPERFAPRPVRAWQPIEKAEHVLNKTGTIIRHGGSGVFYRPSNNIIQLPPHPAHSFHTFFVDLGYFSSERFTFFSTYRGCFNTLGAAPTLSGLGNNEAHIPARVLGTAVVALNCGRHC